MINLNMWINKEQDGILIDFGSYIEPEQMEKALEVLYTVADEYLSNIEHDFNETV